MEKQDCEESDIFVGKLKTVGSSDTSLNVTIPNYTCEFCELSDGDLVKFKIIRVKKAGRKK